MKWFVYIFQNLPNVLIKRMVTSSSISYNPMIMEERALFTVKAQFSVLKNLNAHNDVYKNAGAVHGCALCLGTEVLIFIEDVGRHNAVDAIAGKMWLEGINGDDKLFYTTGRLTSEMIIKIAYMGIPALLSRSGVTQMGYKLAKDLNVMMFSRAKGKHFLVYTGVAYLDYDVELPDKVR